MTKRLSRFTLIAVTAASLAFSAGTASANPSDTAGAHRDANAPGDGVITRADDHRPGGAGQGRKVG